MQPALLAADADEYSVTRSLEAYLLWLFGYIMFNNTHGNSWRGESLDHIYIYIRKIIHAFLTVSLLNGCSFAFAT